MELLHKMANREAFKLFFVFSVFINTLNLAYLGIDINPLFFIVLPWGIYIVLHDVCCKELFYKGNHLLCLMGYAACLGIATLSNNEYAGKTSLLILGLQGLIFLLVFGSRKSMTLLQMKTEMRHINISVCVLTCIASSISLLMFLFNVTLTSHGVTIGLLGNRLFGIYFNSNPASFLACMSIVFAIIAIRNHYRFLPFYVFNIAVQVFYILLSNCRSALLIVAGMVVVILYYTIFKRKEYSMGKQILISIVAVVVFALGSGVIKESLFLIPKLQGAVFNDESRFNQEDISELLAMLQDNPWGNRKEILAIADDISSSRIELWYESYEVWKTSPIVGIGVGTFRPMGMEMFPESQVLAAPQVVHTHNIFVEAMVTAGLVGFLFFFLFTFKSFTSLLETLRKYAYTKSYFIILLCSFIIFIEFFGSLLDYGVFYVYSLSALLFWNYLGYLYWLHRKPKMRLVNDHMAYEFSTYRLAEVKFDRDNEDTLLGVGLRIMKDSQQESNYIQKLAIVLFFAEDKTSYFTYIGTFAMRKEFATPEHIQSYRKEMALELYDVVKSDIVTLTSDERGELTLPEASSDMF